MSLSDYATADNAGLFIERPQAREDFEVARLQKDLTAQHTANQQELAQQEKALLPVSVGLSIMHGHGLLDYDFVKLDERHMAIDITLKQSQVNTSSGVITGSRERFVEGSDVRAVPELAFTKIRDLLDRIESTSVDSEVAAVQAARADIDRNTLFGRHDLAQSRTDIRALAM